MKRDHGGGLDAAIAEFGGTRKTWLDLSTGINPDAYPLPDLPHDAWTALPDQAALDRLIDAARALWNVPAGAAILPTHGASAPIARIPSRAKSSRVLIPQPTYNEHAAAFEACGIEVIASGEADTKVMVNPNNPDGRYWGKDDLTAALNIVDESFGDVDPNRTLIQYSDRPDTLVLKSFGKFWGLAGLRLGFVVGHPDHINPLRDTLGPWSVSGPALAIGAKAFSDHAWNAQTRAHLQQGSDRLDTLMTTNGAQLVGGTTLFRLYEVDNATAWQRKLAQHHVWSRIFPYSDTYLRLGLPAADRWGHLENALS
ncbi:threonine-phosphate decarboxylase [Cochlodiniinecator piscidefendens]|uniref:threonine-phosphate decarboxylase n=1 Tax=Cochlodiniinecator piscidefendens TaxID=2715756 RepID=UPI00140E7D44|nr:threonine-phosphate decarboxylase [Cochlodiniinecator piscidefendens]